LRSCRTGIRPADDAAEENAWYRRIARASDVKAEKASFEVAKKNSSTIERRAGGARWVHRRDGSHRPDEPRGGREPAARRGPDGHLRGGGAHRPAQEIRTHQGSRGQDRGLDRAGARGSLGDRRSAQGTGEEDVAGGREGGGRARTHQGDAQQRAAGRGEDAEGASSPSPTRERVKRDEHARRLRSPLRERLCPDAGETRGRSARTRGTVARSNAASIDAYRTARRDASDRRGAPVERPTDAPEIPRRYERDADAY